MNHLQQLAQEIEETLGTQECLACPTFLKSIISKARRFGFHAEEARELAHETLTTLLMKAHNRELRCKSSIRAFAHGIHRNLCRKRLRRQRSQKRGNDATHCTFDDRLYYGHDAALHHWGPLKILKKKEKWKLVEQWISTLKNEDYQAVFTLLLKGYNRREIGKKLDLPLQRIDAIISYGKKKFADHARTHHRQSGMLSC